ncbi:MAG: hypothetical protein ACK46L_05895 [Synechococcaceae cyanobacterium]
MATALFRDGELSLSRAAHVAEMEVSSFIKHLGRPIEDTSAHGTHGDTAPVHPRETSAAMAHNIDRELAEIEQAIGRCSGDRVAEPRLTGTWMAHLPIRSAAIRIPKCWPFEPLVYIKGVLWMKG